MSVVLACFGTFSAGQAAAHKARGASHHRLGHLETAHHGASHRHVAAGSHTRFASFSRHHQHRYAALQGAHVIQCVAFAKADAHIIIAGNARDWWGNAAGVYARGSRPETGSVLSFRPSARIPLGHVAVVSDVLDSRTIMIDQSHWISRGITRNMVVHDVSENNDWTAVRVQLGRGEAFGSIYETHGFIYPRPDNGASFDANDAYAPRPAAELIPARRHARRRSAALEVAEIPEPARGLALDAGGLVLDAPDRALR